ncbi:MAG: hypothetical protein AB9835_07930 [Eubacteriales bacterium]
MKNTTHTDITPISPHNKYTATSCILAAYFILSSLLYYFNPLRLTEEIKSGFIGFILGLGDTAEVLEVYFTEYSVINLMRIISAIWTVGLVLSLVGFILAFFKRTRSVPHQLMFAGGLTLLAASLICVIGVGYYNSVNSEALMGLIFLDMPLGALIGFVASGAMCISSGWVIYEGIKRYVEEKRGAVRKPGRLRALSYDESRPRSYIKGTGGALLGLLIGGLPWIVLIVLDIFGAFFGISIGLLTRLFYERMGGKEGRMKQVILFAVAILGVPVIEIIGYSTQIAFFILSGEIVRRSFFELWGDVLYNISSNSTNLISLLVDTGVGIIFAAICVSGVFSNKNKKDKTA